MESKKIMVKLVSIASDFKSQTNAEGKVTNFYPCTVEYKSPATGELVQSGARVFEGNFKYGVSVGETYSAEARPYVDAAGELQVDMVMSHLQGANRPKASDFGFVLPTTPVQFDQV